VRREPSNALLPSYCKDSVAGSAASLEEEYEHLHGNPFGFLSDGLFPVPMEVQPIG
jgi:hypothetical protein